MALDLVRLTLNIKNALVAAGADPVVPATTAFATGLAGAVMTELQNAIVSPAGIPTPMSTAPTGGPVLGAGKLT